MIRLDSIVRLDSIDPDFQRLTTMDWGLPRPWFTMGRLPHVFFFCEGKNYEEYVELEKTPKKGNLSLNMRNQRARCFY